MCTLYLSPASLAFLTRLERQVNPPASKALKYLPKRLSSYGSSLNVNGEEEKRTEKEEIILPARGDTPEGAR